MHAIVAFTKWCDALPLAEQARMLKDAGFDGVDLPCRLGSAITPQNAPERLPEAKRILADHGLTLARLACELDADDRAGNERFFACLAQLDIRRIRAASFSIARDTDIPAAVDRARRRLASLESQLARFGILGAVQNHSGDFLENNISALLRLLDGRDPAVIGVQYDPGHCAVCGEKPWYALALMGAYLHGVNIKSPRIEHAFDPETRAVRHMPIWVPLADGMLDVPLLLDELRRAGYAGPLSMHSEYRTHYSRLEHHPHEVLPVLACDVAYLRACMAESERRA